MLKFLLFDGGRPAKSCSLRNAHLIGSDGNAIRSDIRFKNGIVECEKRDAGAAALALQRGVGDCGELTVQTCLLPDRGTPYLLSLEFARHQLMIIYNKLEDWGMFDLGPNHAAIKRANRARKHFIEALCRQHDDPKAADKAAAECLSISVDGSEELALAHAETLISKRTANGDKVRLPIGCGVTVEHNSERIRAALAANFDYVCLPVAWRQLAPAEADYDWVATDNWFEWAARARLPVTAGPIISFEPHMLPDWLYIWEHDFDTLRDLIYEHIETVVNRYGKYVNKWIVLSGLHVNSHFTMSFDQIMDLSRMTTMLVKRTQPDAKVLVEIRQPFGEYYANNAKSIPPLMYGDLLVQGAVNFDGLAVKLLMGQAMPGQYSRDLMQISHMLDQFSMFAKPVALSVAVPSEPVTQMMIAASDGDTPVDADSGYWRKPWSQQVQSHWLEALFKIARSKPHIDSIAWHELVDHPNIEMPLGGLVSEDMQLKWAFRRLVAFRKNLNGNANGAANGKKAPAAEGAPQ